MKTNSKRNYTTRVAPSPTGPIHIGTASIISFCWYYSSEGTLNLRIDDTDLTRSKPAYKKEIMGLFKFLQVKYELLVQQSDRRNLYERYKKLIPTSCIDPNNGTHRLSPPNTDFIEFQDLNYGKLRRRVSDVHFPVCYNRERFFYSYCSAVDDIEMNTELIIRGADLIDSTFAQQRMFESVGREMLYLHLPLMLDKESRKISKRSPDERYTIGYLKGKYIPEVLKIYLLYPDISTKGEISARVYETPPKARQGNWRYDVDKLHKIQQSYVSNMPAEDLFEEIIKWYNVSPSDITYRAIDVWKVRCVTLDKLALRITYYNNYYNLIKDRVTPNLKRVERLIDLYDRKSLDERQYRLYSAYRRYVAGCDNSPSLRELISLIKI